MVDTDPVSELVTGLQCPDLLICIRPQLLEVCSGPCWQAAQVPPGLLTANKGNVRLTGRANDLQKHTGISCFITSQLVEICEVDTAAVYVAAALHKPDCSTFYSWRGCQAPTLPSNHYHRFLLRLDARCWRLVYAACMLYLGDQVKLLYVVLARKEWLPSQKLSHDAGNGPAQHHREPCPGP